MKPLIPYQNLTELRLGRNQIKQIDFSCLPNLEFVSLFSNYIEKIKGLDKLKHLWSFDIRNNLIETYFYNCFSFFWFFFQKSNSNFSIDFKYSLDLSHCVELRYLTANWNPRLKEIIGFGILIFFFFVVNFFVKKENSFLHSRWIKKFMVLSYST